MAEGWDQSRFESVLKEYVKASSRTVAEAINAKAYFIARAAVHYTHKASAKDIRDQLSRPGRESTLPLAAMIVRRRRRSKREPELSASELEAAGRRLISVRVRSVAFLKSGWLPAIRTLAPFVKSKGQAKPLESTVRQVGAEKGSATPAFEGHTAIAKLVNSAIAKHDKKDSLSKYGGRGLQLAFEDETSSMIEYLEQKMRPDAEAANSKLK